MSSPLAKPTKIALLQFKADEDKQKVLAKTKEYAAKAMKEQPGTDILVLPELFTCLLDSKYYKKNAETIPEGETTQCLSDIAKSYKVNIIGGSIPELDKEDGKLYNASVIFNREGTIIGKHRKVHLFDCSVGGLVCKESNTFTPGKKATAVSIDGIGTAGVAICHDVKFPELATIAARPVEQGGQGAGVMFYPSAVSTIAGPKYWYKFDLARAVDNQVYVVMCAAARDDRVTSYMSFAHSLVIDPNGDIIVEAGIGEEIVYCELKPEVIAQARAEIPLIEHRRFDVYKNVALDASVGNL